MSDRSLTLDALLGMLKGARKSGGGFVALCPSHADTGPSLSVREENGRLLWHCFAGCSFESVLNGLGIDARDLFEDGSAGNGPRILATYDYRDEQGQLLFQVLRYSPKTFKQRKPDGNGWIWKLGDVRRVLFRLPELLAAKDTEIIVVPEGEKDCLTAVRLGFIATCNPGGAGKWRGEYSEFLRGKRVAIIADADEVGRAHAQQVATSLHLIAGSVKVLELPNAKDLSEWHEHRGTREQLLQLILDAQEWKPQETTSAKSKAPIPGVLASEVKPEKVRWLWENHIPFGKVTLFDGDPDEGKSLVSLDLVARFTRGWAMPPLAGRPDGSQGGCSSAGAVVVSLEDGVADTIVPRLQAAGAALERVRIISVIKSADGIEDTPTIPGDLAAIEAAIQDVGAKLLIIDPLVATLDPQQTNSYKDQDIRRALAPLGALAERLGIAVVCIRHLTKGGGENPKYRGGGSIGLTGLARAEFLIGHEPEHEDTHVLAPVKGNLWRGKPASLKFTIKEADSGEEPPPIIAWEGESSLTARALLAQPESAEEAGALAIAKNFLTELLQDGPVDSRDVERAARQAGISDRTLFRAKDRLGIISNHFGFGRKQHWEWELPKPAIEIAKPENLAISEQISETKPVTSTISLEIANSGNLAISALKVGNLSTPAEGNPSDAEAPAQDAPLSQPNLFGPASLADGFRLDVEGCFVCVACEGRFETLSAFRAHMSSTKCVFSALETVSGTAHDSNNAAGAGSPRQGNAAERDPADGDFLDL